MTTEELSSKHYPDSFSAVSVKLPLVLLSPVEASTSLAAPAPKAHASLSPTTHPRFLGRQYRSTMERPHWSYYNDGTYPSAEDLPWPAMTLRDACLWRARLVDELPEHQQELITLHDIAQGHTISPITSTLIPVPQREGVFQRSNMIYTTQIARLDGRAAHADTDRLLAP